MSTLVASAFVSSNDPRWPEGVPELAIERHREWCKSQEAEYMLITDEDMEPFRKLSEWPDSWAFGTLSKFVAIKRFLHRYLVSEFDRFIWMDLDCIPGQEATIKALDQYGINSFVVGPHVVHESWLPKSNNCFLIGKYAFHECAEFHSVSTHLFSITAPIANEIMRYIEHGVRFGTYEWFKCHNEAVKVSAEIAKHVWQKDPEAIDIDALGNDEAYIEGYAQKRLDVLGWYDNQLVSNYDHYVKGLFTHYYGDAKRLIPEALA